MMKKEEEEEELLLYFIFLPHPFSMRTLYFLFFAQITLILIFTRVSTQTLIRYFNFNHHHRSLLLLLPLQTFQQTFSSTRARA